MKRSTALPVFSLFGGAAALLAPQAASAQSKKSEDQPKRPNIIYIMSDDHAHQAISAYGHPIGEVAPTPNIDRIAQSGVRFDRAYCGNSISGPSRATVITGKHSHKNGFRRNDGIPFDGSQQTLAKVMGENGYATALVGKWHLISYPTGYDYWNILNNQGEYYNPDFISHTGDTIRRHGYVTDLITDESIEWIEQHRQAAQDGTQPFFIQVHHKAPHRTWQPAERHLYLHEHTFFPYPENFFDDYEGRIAAQRQEMSIASQKDMMFGYDLKLSVGPNTDTWVNDGWGGGEFRWMDSVQKEKYIASYRARNNKFWADPPTGDSLVKWKFQQYMRDYTATIAAVDDGVGKLLDYLDASGLSENTLVIYASDQSFYLGEHGWFDKRFIYEESMRMPLLMKLPGHIPEGFVADQALVQNIDFAPTMLDFAGIETPSDMQGVSFRKIAEGQSKPKGWRNSLYYRYYEEGIHNVMQHAGVHAGDWKLVYFYSNEKEGQPSEYFFELYDLKSDPLEMKNIYGQKGTEKMTQKLMKELNRLAAMYEDTLPPCPELSQK